MKETSIELAGEVYSCCEEIIINKYKISFPDLGTFSFHLDRFINHLGELKEEDFWISTIRKMKKFRFEVSAAPLSEKYLSAHISGLISFLKNNVDQIEIIYPNQFTGYLSLIHDLERLSEGKLSILLQAIHSHYYGKRKNKSAILIKEPGLIPYAQEAITVIEGNRVIEIISIADLRVDNCYDNLVVIGPARWFPDYIFFAPRSRHISIFKYKWIHESNYSKLTFIDPIKSRDTKTFRIILDEETQDGEEASDADILRIETNFQRIEKRAEAEIYKQKDEEFVESRMFVLEQDWGVFLEADDTSRIDVIDLDGEPEKRVKRILIRDIDPGMFILLRSEGGGDYIVPLADKIMGSFASIARDIQKKWKSLLRTHIREHGIYRVIEKLKEYGSTRANELNIEHWVSFRGIKTESINDFAAIMKMVGLERYVEEYWDTMEEINRAHTRAGFQIRKMLLEQISKRDLTQLERTGIMDFELSSQDAGSLTVYRVVEKSPNSILVIHHRIRNPFKLDTDLESLFV